MSLVTWNNRMAGPPVVNGSRSVPKKPVIWHGEIWLKLPDGSKDARSWRSKQKITRQQAQEVMAAMLADLVAENGENAAVDAGFWMQSR